MTLEDKVKKFNVESKITAISYGGDGTLLQTVHDFPKRVIIPIRNYGNCNQHNATDLIDTLCKDSKAVKDSLKIKVFPRLRFTYRKDDGTLTIPKLALSEVVIKNVDISTALRFDVYVNGHLYLENVICDGIVTSTPLGSHGYFKSVTRTMFYDGIGIAFIAPTYGICNLILKNTDTIHIKLKRTAKIYVAADKDTNELVLKEGTLLTLEDSCENVSISGYSHFMCTDCRKNRNSTIINDQYFI